MLPVAKGGLLGGSSRRLKDIDRSVEEISTIHRRLEEVAGRLEKDFLTTSQAMEELSKHGDEFMQNVKSLVGIATGKQGGVSVFNEAIKVVQDPLNFLIESHDRALGVLSQLRDSSENIAKLLGTQGDIQRAMAPLKHIQTLFKIESAPLGHDVQVVFASLTQEFEQLQAQVTELFTLKFKELQNIKLTIEKAALSLQTQSDKIWALVSAEKNHIECSLGKLHQDLDKNHQREANVFQNSQNVTDAIQQVITGLQYQDIINQKAQHVDKALGEMLEGAGDSEEARRLLAQISRVQTEQVASIRHDLSHAEETVRNGTNAISVALEMANTQCISLEEFDRLTTSTDGMVQVLLDVFATLRLQIDLTVKLCTEMTDALRPFDGLASDLTQVARGLSHRIHLIGLNAQLRAAGVQNGIGLEVLSAHTSEISRETGELSRQVAQRLDGLLSGLSEINRTLDTLRQEALAQQNEMNLRWAVSEKSLHSLRDEALERLTLVGEALDGVRECSRRVDDSLVFVSAGDPVFADLEDKLQGLSKLTETEWNEVQGESNGVLSQLENQYSMASERRAHAAAVSGEQSLSARINYQAVEEDGGVDLFDTSFEDLPPAQDPVSDGQAVVASAAVADPVLSGHEPKTAKPSAPQPDFGDNVELF